MPDEQTQSQETPAEQPQAAPILAGQEMEIADQSQPAPEQQPQP